MDEQMKARIVQLARVAEYSMTEAAAFSGPADPKWTAMIRKAWRDRAMCSSLTAFRIAQSQEGGQ